MFKKNLLKKAAFIPKLRQAGLILFATTVILILPNLNQFFS